ncbi:hypothetical protein ACFYMI_39990 [Streptomyces collinus]|uniref:hypothetical protein n=1 Tax=Streptomyces collinus TaxID=42684 RepID=UPI0036A997D5
MTADQFHEDNTGAYFTFDKNPVLLPPTLARLIERQIAEDRRHSAVGAVPDSEHQLLLLPGRLAGRPRSHGGLAAQLAKHGSAHPRGPQHGLVRHGR